VGFDEFGAFGAEVDAPSFESSDVDTDHAAGEGVLLKRAGLKVFEADCAFGAARSPDAQGMEALLAIGTVPESELKLGWIGVSLCDNVVPTEMACLRMA